VNFAYRTDGQRIAVLRPVDVALSIRRLREWNEILDRAADEQHAQDRAKAKADEHWKTALKEQQWRFLGYLGDDTKSVLDGKGDVIDAFVAGDLTEAEQRVAKLWGP